MNLFGSSQKVDPQQEARAEASRQSILGGGLPLNAIDRLKEQASRQGTDRHIFTSDLSPSELLLTRECGFLPLGQVMGSCAYNIGFQYVSSGQWVYSSGELGILSEAQFNARQLAFSRLVQEAQLLRADGVVGVRFERKRGDFGSGMVEFIAIGTAVRRINAPPLAPNEQPFVSNLSGQDHWMLRKEGYKPVGFSFGNCSWYQYPDWRSQNAMMSWSNAELTSVTQGLYTAREIAMTRLEFEARAVHSEGIVGVSYDTHVEHLESSQNSPGGFIIAFTAWGTAIAREDSRASAGEIKPVVSIKD